MAPMDMNNIDLLAEGFRDHCTDTEYALALRLDDALKMLRVCFEQSTRLSSNENVYSNPSPNSGRERSVSVVAVKEFLNIKTEG